MLSQGGLYMADLTLNGLANSHSSPTEAQTHDTAILDRTTLRQPSFTDQVLPHVGQRRWPHAQSGCGFRLSGSRIPMEIEQHLRLSFITGIALLLANITGSDCGATL